MTEDEKATVTARINPSLNIKDIVDADLVIEAATENMDLKKKIIFAELDEKVKPEAILATNTSSLSITEIAAATNRPQKVIGMHFFNPVPVMKLIEVINGIATDQDTYDSIFNMCEKLGKKQLLKLKKLQVLL